MLKKPNSFEKDVIIQKLQKWAKKEHCNEDISLIDVVEAIIVYADKFLQGDDFHV